MLFVFSCSFFALILINLVNSTGWFSIFLFICFFESHSFLRSWLSCRSLGKKKIISEFHSGWTFAWILCTDWNVFGWSSRTFRVSKALLNVLRRKSILPENRWFHIDVNLFFLWLLHQQVLCNEIIFLTCF